MIVHIKYLKWSITLSGHAQIMLIIYAYCMYLGNSGTKGERGESGPEGEEGPIGLPGGDGPEGRRGPGGPAGPTGVAGPRGTQRRMSSIYNINIVAL